MNKEDMQKTETEFFKHFSKKYPPKKKKAEEHRSRFDHMSPERLQFWKEEHQ